jgi:pimeloyl-ACP methyl ester carboxylesterase
MPFAELERLRLFYTDEGEGDPSLLFVHGLSCDSHDWIWQLPHFRQHHRTIAVDLRGHGRSDAVAGGYGLGDHAEDLVALLDHLGVPRVVAIGHSLGGMIVTVLAVAHPERVSAIVVIDPGYLHPLSETEEAASFVRQNAQTDPIGLFRAMLEPTYQPDSPAPLRTWHMRRLDGMDRAVLTATLQTVPGGNGTPGYIELSEDYLTRRACPVLALYEDSTRAERDGALFGDSRSKAVAWPGVCHWPQQERPDAFNALLDGWLSSLGPR